MRKVFTSYLRLTLVVLTLLSPLRTAAQHETHHFKNPQLSALYTRANRAADTREGLILADSLLRMATAEGDSYSELMAMSVKTRYAFDHVASYQQLESIVKPMMTKALQTGHPGFYYMGVSYLLTFLTNHDRLDEALKLEDEQMKFAASHHHYHGMAICHLALGNIFWTNKQVAESINEYQQAISCFDKSSQRQFRNFSVAYKMIADSYLIVGQFDQLLKAADNALAVSQPEQVTNGMYGYRAFALFMLGRDAEFLTAYKLFKRHQSERAEMQEGAASALEAMNLIVNGRDSEAQSLIDKHQGDYFWNFVHMAYLQRKKQYVALLDVMRQANIEMYGIKSRSLLTTLHYASAQINNRIAEIEKQKAAYELAQAQNRQTQLSQQKANIELQQTKEKEQLALLDAENNRLSFGNHQLATRHLQDSIDNQLTRQNYYEQQQTARNITLSTIVALILLLTAITYGLLQKNKKRSQQLRGTHNELEQTLDELNTANDEAQRSDLAKTKFIQAMSHEIRTPLNAIVGFTQVLTEMEDDITEEETTRIIKQITDNSETLSTLVNSILDLTNIETGNYTMRHDAFSVNQLCRSVILETRYMKHSTVALNYHSDVDDAYEITGDKLRVQQVINNMLTNAMKNTIEGNITLDCTTLPEQQSITFSVTDTGCGIPKDKQEEVFERFKKLDTFKQGVGLGLEICRTIAHKMGGTFTIDATYTQGARFVFTIPTKLS